MADHTRTRRWRNIIIWGIVSLVVGVIGQNIVGALEIRGAIYSLFDLPIFAGLILIVLGGVKLSGGLKTGIIALVTGAVVFLIGYVLLEQVETFSFMEGEFRDTTTPMYWIAISLRAYGILLLITGAIMTVSTYLRRLLKAVESSK